MGITRAPPVPLSLCSQMLSEAVVRVYVVAKEDVKRERRHQSASALARGNTVVLLMCGLMLELLREESRSSLRVCT